MYEELGVSLFGVRERRLEIPLASFLPWISSISSINTMQLCSCFGSRSTSSHHLSSGLRYSSLSNAFTCHMSSRVIHAVLFIVISVRIVVMYSSCAGPYPCLQVYPSLITANSTCPSITILNLVLLGGWLLLDEVVSWIILEVEGVACYVLVNGPGKREESTY